MADEETVPAPKPRVRRVAVKKKIAKTNGRKTLVAAVVGAILAAVDLYMTIRLGVKIF